MYPHNTPSSLPAMHKTLIDGKFNLFTFDEYGDNVQNLLILAHGIVVQPNSLSGIARRITGTLSFAVPIWTTLFFYAPHGYVLTTPNIEDFMTGVFPPLEACLPGETVTNYELYFKNTQYPLATDMVIEMYLAISRSSPFCPYFSQHPFRVYDIITTEPSDPKGSCLRELLDTLYRTGHIYPRVHCAFCRSEYFTADRIYKPGYHNPPFSQSQVNKS